MCAKLIKFTHIVNPHLFWFTYKNQPNESAKIEDAIALYVKQNGDDVKGVNNRNCHLERVVAVYSLSMKKWIRAEIDVTGETPCTDDLIVWATDYGIPIKTSLDLVAVLSTELSKLCMETPSAVYKGGIFGIMPAAFKLKARVGIERDEWDQRCIETLENIKLHPEVSVSFYEKFNSSSHSFGDIIIKNEHRELNIGTFFEEEFKLAMSTAPAKFERDILSKNSIKMARWCKNSGEQNCIRNWSHEESAMPSTSISESSNANGMTSDPKNSEPTEEIDQHQIKKMISRRVVFKSNEQIENQRDNPSNEKENQPPVKYPADSVTSETQSSSTRRSALLKKFQERMAQQKPVNTNEACNAPTFEVPKGRVDLQELNEAKLANKVKLIPILVRNNEEEPIEAIQAAVFTKQVHKGMRKMNFQETYLNQAYAWPNLLRGNSLVLVDSQNKGKTIAYLPALCSVVQKAFEEADRDRIPTKVGATAIIVTSNVQKIADMCRTLLQLPAIVCNVVEAIGTRDAVNVIVKLYNGCNILVATAPCLAKLIKGSPNAIKSDKLKCVAFENIDCIMEKYKIEIDLIVNELCLSKSYKGDPRQIIVTSRTWRSSLLKFLNEKFIADSVLLIGNYLEAAIFAGVTLNFNLCQSEVKCEQLTEYIKNIPYSKERTLVVCNEADETEQVAKCFEMKNISYELVKEIESSYAKAKVKAAWENKSGILICTDNHLTGIFNDSQQIQNAQHILHFSLPTQDFRKFLHRFVVMLDFYNHCDPGASGKPKATSTVFIDNENVQQLPKLVDLLTRDGQQIPMDLFNISQTARKLKIKEKAERLCFEPICNMLFIHGTSEHQANCDCRHLLLPSDLMDESSQQPTSGHLRFNLIKCISPTEYIVRPIFHSAGYGEEYRSTNGSDQFESLDEELQTYYKLESNQKVLGALELGQKCVISVQGKYFRAQIVRIFEKRSITDVDKYKVRLIDTGETDVLNSFHLYTLAEQFQALPDQAVRLHLTGVIPADQEEEWDPRVCAAIGKHLLALNEPDTIYEANIVFSLRNTIVVDIMRIVDKQGIVRCSIKKYLNNKSYAILCNDSRKKVFEMVKTQGIKIAKQQKANTQQSNANLETLNSTPKNLPSSSPKATNNIDSCATVSANNQNNSRDDLASENSALKEDSSEKWACPWKWQHKKVFISQFNNTNQFYVTQQSKQRDDLYIAIDKYVEETITLNDSMQQPDVYKYCLVNFDDKFYRAKVLDIIYDDDKIEMKVLLVDTGLCPVVEIENVYDIPDDLIQRFPFQAIWCNLIGIKAVENESDEKLNDIIDEIYDTIDQYGNDLIIHTVSTDRAIKSNIPDTNLPRHDVVLLAVNEEKQINLNEMLVAMNLTEFDAATKSKLDNVPNLFEGENADDSDSDSDSNWDNEEYVSNKWKMTDETYQQDAENQNGAEIDYQWLEDYPQDEFQSFLKDLYSQHAQKEPVKEPIQNGLPEEKHCLESIQEEDGLDNKTEDSTECSEDVEEDPNDRAVLEYIYKRPQTIWWQDEESIVLKISTLDNVKYGLEVTSDSLFFGTKVNDEQIVAVINFFGYVDFEKTLHEIRGLNVVVRLRKECPIMWPRLTMSSEKYSWLIKNVDAVKDDPLYDEAMGQFAKEEQAPDVNEDLEQLAPTQLFEVEDDVRTLDDSSEGS